MAHKINPSFIMPLSKYKSNHFPILNQHRGLCHKIKAHWVSKKGWRAKGSGEMVMCLENGNGQGFSCPARPSHIVGLSKALHPSSDPTLSIYGDFLLHHSRARSPQI